VIVTPGRGLAAGIAGFGSTLAMTTTSALRHVGWWLEWQTRTHPGEASRPLADSSIPEGVDRDVA
jgi:hypothetical protein